MINLVRDHSIMEDVLRPTLLSTVKITQLKNVPGTLCVIVVLLGLGLTLNDYSFSLSEGGVARPYTALIPSYTLSTVISTNL